MTCPTLLHYTIPLDSTPFIACFIHPHPSTRPQTKLPNTHTCAAVVDTVVCFLLKGALSPSVRSVRAMVQVGGHAY